MAAAESGITLGDTVFDHVVYDRQADVLYLHAGNPTRAVEFDESPEGHALRYDADGELVGVTIVNARKHMEQHSGVSVTLPHLPTFHVDAKAVTDALGLDS